MESVFLLKFYLFLIVIIHIGRALSQTELIEGIRKPIVAPQDDLVAVISLDSSFQVITNNSTDTYVFGDIRSLVHGSRILLLLFWECQ